MAPFKHGFKEPKWASPKEGFSKAKKQLESSEWEDVVDGVIIMVALSKKNPEVSFNDQKIIGHELIDLPMLNVLPRFNFKSGTCSFSKCISH